MCVRDVCSSSTDLKEKSRPETHAKVLLPSTSGKGERT